MNILGISCFYHDAAAVLVIDGEVKFAIEEERLSRKKHDFSFPSKAVDACLENQGISISEIDAVVFYEKPIPKFIRIVESTLLHAPYSHRVFVAAMQEWLGAKLWMKNVIAKELGCDESKIFFCDHHMSHAASAFFSSPFDTAAILTVDGVGERSTTMIAYGENQSITPLVSMHFPDSLGLLYSVFTAFLGFEVNEGEYKVMGMAPYGTPRYLDKVRKLMIEYKDGSFALRKEFFSFTDSLEHGYSERFLRLFGPSRIPESKFFTAKTEFPSYYGAKPSNYAEQCLQNEYYADISASIQRYTEEAVLRLAQHAMELTGSKNLCMAGGVALNSTANGRIIRESGAAKVYIQPSAGDAGGALGAALWAHHVLFKGARTQPLVNAYLGKAYGKDTIAAAIAAAGLKSTTIEEEELLAKYIANALAEGKVIGFFHGRSEWGPRALGARSILADPRSTNMKDLVNTKIKFREPFRPFAPIVLDTYARDYFELPNTPEEHLTAYMLMTTQVRQEKQADIPAVTHVDGSSRVQVLTKTINPRLYGVITNFYELTGVPIVLNTSFNVRGEPIVESPEDAIRTFLQSGIDVLVLENTICTKISAS